MASPSRLQVLSLFRSLLRTARDFPDYNIREYTKRRTIDAFRQNKALSNSSLVAAAFSDGKAQLEIAKRQAVVYGLYASKIKSAARAVASATMTPLTVETPPNRILELVAKGLAAEKDEVLRGVSSAAPFDPTLAAGYGSIPAPRAISVDFSSAHDTKGSSKNFPKHESRHISEHKSIARCARFSCDGRFLATGSADPPIKLFEVSKVKQMLQSDSRDGPVRPVIRTFYDHTQVILLLQFR